MGLIALDSPPATRNGAPAWAEDLGLEVLRTDVARPERQLTHYLPHVAVVTTLVAVVPVADAWILRAEGLISPWVSVAVAVVLSLAFSRIGNTLWRRHRRGNDLLFSDLLVWGWLRRWRTERRLASATHVLDLPPAIGGSSRQERERQLRRLAGALEAQDMYLAGHSRRVARHGAMIAQRLGLPKEFVSRVRAAAAMHDVGKLRVPAQILNKPDKLTPAEFDVVKRHSVDGAEIVAALGDPLMTAIVRHHHERLDGSGYPDHLTANEIPLGARIIGVADTFDAITSARPYRPAASHQRAIEILQQESGKQLDSDVVRAFLGYYTGNRAVAVWAASVGLAQRAIAGVSGDVGAAATAPLGKLAAIVAATAVIGAAAAAVPVPSVAHHHTSRPVVAHPSRLLKATPRSHAQKHGVAAARGRHALHARVVSAARAHSASHATVASHTSSGHRSYATGTGGSAGPVRRGGGSGGGATKPAGGGSSTGSKTPASSGTTTPSGSGSTTGSGAGTSSGGGPGRGHAYGRGHHGYGLHRGWGNGGGGGHGHGH